MTIDFLLEAENGNLINSKALYTFSMNSATNNELPLITEDYSEMFNQTCALFATINKGQLPMATDFGIETIYKQFAVGSDIYSQRYLHGILSDLDKMLTTFFLENEEVREWVLENYQVSQVTPVSSLSY